MFFSLHFFYTFEPSILLFYALTKDIGAISLIKLNYKKINCLEKSFHQKFYDVTIRPPAVTVRLESNEDSLMRWTFGVIFMTIMMIVIITMNQI